MKSNLKINDANRAQYYVSRLLFRLPGFVPYRTLLSLLWCLLFLLTSSCSMLQLKGLATFPLAPEHTQAYADQLFINGDFENAILEYEQIYETALSPEDKNQALYGLACTQMMLAHTEEQLVEAISNLQKWDAIKGRAPFVENRHLLILSLKQQSEIIQEKNKQLLARDKQQTALIAAQQAKMARMTATVEKLSNQIAELEAIDENVQEKRNPL